MSGSAALSAARKRRASSSQMPGNINTNTNTNANTIVPPGGSYYGGGSSKQSLQGIMNQTPYSSAGQAPGFVFPKELLPNVPYNIYENIELIKKQIADRTKLIQTQGSSIPADKLRILQKQNEVQAQILKQKTLIAQQMEIMEQKNQKEQQALASQRHINTQTNNSEPEFIYEKGIPRKNPKYKKLEEPVPIKPIQNPDHMQSSSHDTRLSPFISMITETGVIPPPIVILKSHDEKLEEHHIIIKDMLEQLDYLHSIVTTKSERVQSIKEETNDKKSGNGQATAQQPSKEQAPEEEEEEEEDAELLMEVVMNDLTNSREFVEGIVDKIVNDTNLSEVIMKIEPIIKENQELRGLLHSQQQMMNEINTMLFRLLNQQNSASSAPSESSSNVVNEPQSPVVFQDDGLNGDGLYETELTEIVLMPSLQSSNDIQEVQEVQEVQDFENHVLPPNTDDKSNHEEHTGNEQISQENVQVQYDIDHDQHQDQHQDQGHSQYHHEEVDYQGLDSNYEEYSDMPHFPEPISLVVSEL